MGDKSAHNCCRSISLCAMSGFLGELKKFIQQRCDGADDDVDVDGWILILVKKKNPQFLCCVVWLVCVHFVSRPNYNWSVLWLHGATKAGFAPPFFLSACLSVWFLVLSLPLVQWRRRRRRWLVESVRCATGAWWWKSLNIDVNNRRTNERTNERFFCVCISPTALFVRVRNNCADFKFNFDVFSVISDDYYTHFAIIAVYVCGSVKKQKFKIPSMAALTLTLFVTETYHWTTFYR